MSASNPTAAGPRRQDDVILRQIAGEVFLVPIRGRLADLQELFVLNAVGEWIWERLDGEHAADALAQELSAAFEVTSDEARVDLEGFLRELSDAGLLAARSSEDRA